MRFAGAKCPTVPVLWGLMVGLVLCLMSDDFHKCHVLSEGGLYPLQVIDN